MIKDTTDNFTNDSLIYNSIVGHLRYIRYSLSLFGEDPAEHFTPIRLAILKILASSNNQYISRIEDDLLSAISEFFVNIFDGKTTYSSYEEFGDALLGVIRGYII